MDFDYTEEQRLLRDSIDRLLADRYAFDKRRLYLAEPEGWSRALWARYDLSDVLTTANPRAGGWVIDGAKSVVPHGDSAAMLIVSARTAGERDDTAGITLFLVDAAANGVARRAYTMRDGTRAAEISL